MKQSQLHILISNMFMVGAFLGKGTGSWFMLFVAFFWMIGAILSWKSEILLERMERKLNQQKFEIIVALLSQNRRKK